MPLALIAVAAVLMAVSLFLDLLRHALLEAVQHQREPVVELVAVGVVPTGDLLGHHLGEVRVRLERDPQ